MNERRIQRMQQLIKQRVAEVVDHELSDPRRGMITITRVKVDKDLHYCDVYWSLLGTETEVKTNERMLQFAAPYVQREVAKILHTRTVPRVRFHHDPGLEKAQHLDQLMAQIRDEREARESAQAPTEPDESAADTEPADQADNRDAPTRSDEPEGDDGPPNPGSHRG